mgnify:CR=1 FL=1
MTVADSINILSYRNFAIIEFNFLKDISKYSNQNLKTMDKDAVNKLKEFDWSGNVRELRNVVERLIILSEKNKITINDVIKY